MIYILLFLANATWGLNIIITKFNYDSFDPLFLVYLKIFFSMLSCATTSAFSAYYPLYLFCKEKHNDFSLLFFGVITLMISKIGIEKIVRYAYPIVGAFGGITFVNSIIGIKNKTNADNNFIHLKNRGLICLKERKIKAKL